jgi:hypothetical protein
LKFVIYPQVIDTAITRFLVLSQINEHEHGRRIDLKVVVQRRNLEFLRVVSSLGVQPYALPLIVLLGTSLQLHMEGALIGRIAYNLDQEVHTHIGVPSKVGRPPTGRVVSLESLLGLVSDPLRYALFWQCLLCHKHLSTSACAARAPADILFNRTKERSVRLLGLVSASRGVALGISASL